MHYCWMTLLNSNTKREKKLACSVQKPTENIAIAIYMNTVQSPSDLLEISHMQSEYPIIHFFTLIPANFGKLFFFLWLKQQNWFFGEDKEKKNQQSFRFFRLAWMCCSSKYPYPSHEMFFSLNTQPPPLRKFHFSVTLSFQNIGLLKPPPLVISVSLPWVEYGYLLEL